MFGNLSAASNADLRRQESLLAAQWRFGLLHRCEVVNRANDLADEWEARGIGVMA